MTGDPSIWITQNNFQRTTQKLGKAFQKTLSLSSSQVFSEKILNKK